ncbi:MAG: hypothetical protein SXA11_21330 [Cyanobacteriota bacterium]|nr:hypothetical protein [Cyanobacteriota bacterium]
MNTGPIPDEIPSNLPEQILIQDAKTAATQMINCKVIQGGPLLPLGDVPRLVANYGGKSEDWVKIVSTQKASIYGAIVQVHWFKNTATGQSVEFKFKRTYPKTAPKNT